MTQRTTESLTLAVTGATGRMGRRVVDAAREDEAFGDVVAVSRPSTCAARDGEHPNGADLQPADELPAILEATSADVLVDFTRAESSVEYVEAATASGVACAVGTSGFDDAQRARLLDASENAPVLRASNFAPAVQALRSAVEAIAAELADYDVEITETYHNGKHDAPSGTSRALFETVEAVRDDLEPIYGRNGDAPRDEREVGIHARRAGDVKGENQVLFAGNHEILELTQRVEDLDVFALGALRAAVSLAHASPGWYELGDV